jgi:hypothetical protein
MAATPLDPRYDSTYTWEVMPREDSKEFFRISKGDRATPKRL